MKLNLYKLCDEKLNVGSIRVVLDGQLKKQVKEIIKALTDKSKLKDISNNLGIDYTTLWDYCHRRGSIPLIVLQKLEHFSKKEFQKENFQFVCGHQKNKVKLPMKIDENLAKIVGAIMADGHLKIRKSKRGQHYELVLREGYKNNVDAFINWFEDVFNFRLELKKQDNHYYIYCSNKIIVLYLTKIIGLPTGKKSDIISVPDIFMNSNVKLKTSLLLGIFMFDGGVDYCTGYIGLTTRSEQLSNDVNKLLNNVNIIPDYVGTTADRYGRWKILFRKNDKLKQCVSLFEDNTEKWYRLQEHFNGLSIKTNDKNIFYQEFNKYYPKTRKSSITFTDVLLAIEQLKQANSKQIGKTLKKGKTTVNAYLSKLAKWKIIRSKRVGLQKYWEINEYYIPRR